MIIALAGRRVDALNAEEPRFPLANVELVRERVRALFASRHVTAMVSSAACGADLVALSEAGVLGIRRRVVLPSPRAIFRHYSVIDRPGEWHASFDTLMREVEATHDLVELALGQDQEAYLAANSTILQDAVTLADQLHQPASAVLIWDGVSRGDYDITEQFGMHARRLGLPVIDISTL